jgi:serine/threonine protein kinase
MAPEFLHGGTITPKSDIFSLGVIILEIVTGHRDYPDVTGTPSDDFIELVRNLDYQSFQEAAGLCS